jgi:hypothetical protein
MLLWVKVKCAFEPFHTTRCGRTGTAVRTWQMQHPRRSQHFWQLLCARPWRGVRCRVQGLGYGVRGVGLGCGVRGAGCGVRGAGRRTQEFGVWR